MTATFDRIADFALDIAPDQIPESTREAAALMVLDTLGITIGAGPMEAGVIARDTAALLYGSSDPRFTSRMMFDGWFCNALAASINKLAIICAPVLLIFQSANPILPNSD